MAAAKKRKSARKTPKKTTPKSAPATSDAAPRASWKIVTRQQLAELLGQHPDTITDFTRDGMPVVTRGGHGRMSAYDAVACLEWWRQKIGRNAKEAAQTRALTRSAELNELKLEQQRGNLISRDEVESAGRAYTAAWRQKVLGLPRRLSQHGVIGLQAEPAVAGVCRELLVEIANWKDATDCDAAAEEAAS